MNKKPMSALLSAGLILTIGSLVLFAWQLFIPDAPLISVIAPLVTMLLGIVFLRQRHVALNKEARKSGDEQQ